MSRRMEQSPAINRNHSWPAVMGAITPFKKIGRSQLWCCVPVRRARQASHCTLSHRAVPETRAPVHSFHRRERTVPGSCAFVGFNAFFASNVRRLGRGWDSWHLCRRSAREKPSRSPAGCSLILVRERAVHPNSRNTERWLNRVLKRRGISHHFWVEQHQVRVIPFSNLSPVL